VGASLLVSHACWSFEMSLIDSREYDWIRLGSYVSKLDPTEGIS
jgi:hypothetical protein